ncbi:MAG: tRNA lysidine(34) synthetase TilS [Bacteroidetes bacterium]|nr:tRNA lysidine(34) synthetase TilS [Bacteroidota bacterium]
MKSQFQTEIFRLNISKSSRIGLAISGGVDSVTLLALLMESGFNNILLLHVNYGLRGQESDDDELFVKNLASQKGVEIKVLDAKNEFKNHSAIQEKARQIRYKWFNELAVSGQIEYIFTAHHQNDLSETFLLNLFRKTGLSGLTGIHSTGIIIRPLLPFSREQIENYAKQHKIEWRNDSSNLKSDYSRNFIRNKIIPIAKDKFPEIVKNIAATSVQLNQERELLLELINKNSQEFWIQKNLYTKVLSLNKIKEYNHASLLLHYLLEAEGFSYTQTEEMIHSTESGKVWENERYAACTSENKLWVIAAGLDFVSHICKWKLGTEKEIDLGLIRISTKQIFEDGSTLLFDESYLGKEIEFRFWNLGDNIQISQKGESKKLSDLFTEKKIPVLFRKAIPVFLIDNQVIWVAGLRISSVLNNPQNTNASLFISVKNLLL